MNFQLSNIRRIAGWMAFYLLLAAPAFSAGSANDNSFVVRHAQVFDGHTTHPATDVWVQDGKIKAVGKDLKVPSGVKVIDGTRETLIPGLIDAHTHAWGDALKEAEIFGVTTELDMFTDVKYMQQTKKEQAEGKISKWPICARRERSPRLQADTALNMEFKFPRSPIQMRRKAGWMPELPKAPTTSRLCTTMPAPTARIGQP